MKRIRWKVFYFNNKDNDKYNNTDNTNNTVITSVKFPSQQNDVIALKMT